MGARCQCSHVGGCLCAHVCGAIVPALSLYLLCFTYQPTVQMVTHICLYLQLTPRCAELKTWRGFLMCCFVLQVQSFCGIFFLLTKHTKHRTKESRQEKFEIIYSSSVVFTCCSLQLAFGTCSQELPKIARNFCSCPCMLHLPSCTLHPGRHRHILI